MESERVGQGRTGGQCIPNGFNTRLTPLECTAALSAHPGGTTTANKDGGKLFMASEWKKSEEKSSPSQMPIIGAQQTTEAFCQNEVCQLDVAMVQLVSQHTYKNYGLMLSA